MFRRLSMCVPFATTARFYTPSEELKKLYASDFERAQFPANIVPSDSVTFAKFLYKAVEPKGSFDTILKDFQTIAAAIPKLPVFWQRTVVVSEVKEFKSLSAPTTFTLEWMQSSEAYGQKNLLFKDSTSELVPIATQTYEAWLGREYLHAVKGLLCDPNRLPHYLRWCVLSTPEIQKCGDMAVAFSRQRLKPEIQCVSAESPQHCMERIQAGQIDAVTLRGEDTYLAGQKHGLVPAAGERYAPDDTSSSYFAVAVVKRNSSDAFSLDELRGRRSCHPGLGSPTGWDIPVGALLRRGFLRPRDCDVLTAVSQFFSASCVPVNNPKNYPASLCALCVGDERGRNKCVGSSQERYYGHRGAFRCLAESAGDVAFVKHTTVFDNTNGHNSEPWAAGLRSEDYELLCPNGARAEVSQFAACNLAQIPPHAVMVRPDTNIYAVYGLLDKAQDLFGDDDNKNGFRMYDSSNYHGQDLLFKDATTRMVPVGEKATYRDWLGPDYVAALEGMLSQQCSGAAAPGLSSPLLPLLLGLPAGLLHPGL